MNSSITSPAQAEPVSDKVSRSLFWAIAVLSVVGIIVSAISLERHYAKSTTSFCEFGQKFNCDIVNRSEYSTLLGIPVAVIGVAGYAMLFVLSIFFRTREQIRDWLLGAALAGLGFALYLTYIEAYVLTTWCILCLISLVLISLISVLAGVLKLRNSRA